MTTKTLVIVHEAKAGNKLHCKEGSTLGTNFQGMIKK